MDVLAKIPVSPLEKLSCALRVSPEGHLGRTRGMQGGRMKAILFPWRGSVRKGKVPRSSVPLRKAPSPRSFMSFKTTLITILFSWNGKTGFHLKKYKGLRVIDTRCDSRSPVCSRKFPFLISEYQEAYPPIMSLCRRLKGGEKRER